MRAWIFQLVAMWVFMVAIHDHHVMANKDESTYAHRKSIIQMYNAPDEALPIFIVGVNGLCIEANRNVPRLATCNKSEIKQKWYLDADYTIRTAGDDSMCLVTNDLTKGSNILILSCDSDSSDYQVWHFDSSNGTLVNPASKYVVDVADLNQAPGSPKQFILWSFYSAGENQKWHIEPSV